MEQKFAVWVALCSQLQEYMTTHAEARINFLLDGPLGGVERERTHVCCYPKLGRLSL